MSKKTFFTSSDLFAAIVALIFLITGGIIANGYLNATAQLKTGDFSINYPASWIPRSFGNGKMYRLENISSQADFREVLQIRMQKYSFEKKKGNVPINPVFAYMTSLQKKFPMYRQFAMKNDVKNRRVEFEFAYVDDPVSPSQSATLPVVVRGICRIQVDKSSQTLFAVSYACDKQHYKEQRANAVALLDSFKIR